MSRPESSSPPACLDRLLCITRAATRWSRSVKGFSMQMSPSLLRNGGSQLRSVPTSVEYALPRRRKARNELCACAAAMLACARIIEARSEEHTSELQSLRQLVCRVLRDTATTEIYTLSLHDALPIYALPRRRKARNELCACAAAMLACARIIEARSEEHTSELQSLRHLVCRLLL